MQYLLRTYATPAAIRNATNELRSIRQSADEDELAYGSRINHEVYRCGNIYEEYEKRTFFIYGLRPETMTLVARFRENQYRQNLTFQRIIQFGKDEEDSFRAMAPRFGMTRISVGIPKTLSGILRIPRENPGSLSLNQQVEFMHEATTLVGCVQCAY